MEDIAQFFKKVMTNEEVPVRDRMKAAELLLKLEPKDDGESEVNVIITVCGEDERKEDNEA